MDYWEDVLLPLSKPFPTQRSTLLEAFWPSSNWKLNYAKVELLFAMPIVDSKDPANCPYYGPKNLKLVSIRDLNNGDFIFMKPSDPLLVLVWLGRTHSDVVKDDQNEFFKMVRVLVKKGSNLNEQHLYEDCWNNKWKCNLVDLEHWLHISNVLLFFP